MKKTCLLMLFAVVALSSCTKNTTNTTIISQLPAFTVNGVHDVTFTNGNTSNYYSSEVQLPITVQYNDSAQEQVTLSISSLPPGIAMDTTWATTGTPTFSTYLTLYDTTQAGATPGTYPMVITATGTVHGKKAYTFNLRVKAAPPCTSYIVGKYYDCFSGCSGSGLTYTDSVYADPNVTNKIWFTNFNNTGSKIYATYNCSSETLTVPAQTVGGVTYSGSGSASTSGHYITLEFTNGSGSGCNLSME